MAVKIKQTESFCIYRPSKKLIPVTNTHPHLHAYRGLDINLNTLDFYTRESKERCKSTFFEPAVHDVNNVLNWISDLSFRCAHLWVWYVILYVVGRTSKRYVSTVLPCSVLRQGITSKKIVWWPCNSCWCPISVATF